MDSSLQGRTEAGSSEQATAGVQAEMAVEAERIHRLGIKAGSCA